MNVESGKIENVSEDECKCETDELIGASKRLAQRLLGVTVTTGPPKAAAVGMELVFVKGGCYQMSDTFSDVKDDEKPVHEVCVSDFFLGKYEVTQGQWKAIMMGNNPSDFKDCGDNCPVENVSWSDIQQFIQNLNRSTGTGYRLPTEAEWEYACRSGGKKERYSGTNDDLDDYAWYDSNSGNRTHPVGQKKPNGLGLYDMSGNAWEWVQDWYNSGYYKNSPKNNPKGPSSGSDRVVRGGSRYDLPIYQRCSNRNYGYAPSGVYSNIGFRLATEK